MDVRTGLELWKGQERERERKKKRMCGRAGLFYVFVASP